MLKLTLALLGVVSGLQLNTKTNMEVMEALSQIQEEGTPKDAKIDEVEKGGSDDEHDEDEEFAQVEDGTELAETEADAEVQNDPNAPRNGVMYRIFNHDHEYHKMYSHGRSVGFWNGGNHNDQIWRLEASDRHNGYFFIENVHHRNCRLASHGNNAFTWCSSRHDD